MALFERAALAIESPVSGVKRTSRLRPPISEFDPVRTSAERLANFDSAMLQLGLIRLPELEMVHARPGGPLPAGWNNMSRPSETAR